MAQEPDQTENPTIETIIGTESDDTIEGSQGSVSNINGHAGSDTLTSGGENDLVAGDMVGTEWSFVNGRWVYDPDAMINGAPVSRDYDDTIDAGAGDDVVLGNGGNDQLFGGLGDDLVNAGTGQDNAFGGFGNDVLNLEQGSDVGTGGAGDDTINAGDGNDLVFGDRGGENIVESGLNSDAAPTLSEYGDGGAWTLSTGENGFQTISQDVSTNPGESYTLNFQMAVNLPSGSSAGAVEVVWNGQSMGTYNTTSGVYQDFEIELPAGMENSEISFTDLTFREVPATESGLDINTDGPIYSYQKEVEIGGEPIDVAAFAPGQTKLYQVIDGQLKVFDPASETYEDAGPPTGFKINAIGFNTEDDMIYGIAKSSGTDALGNPISRSDLVMMDAEGNAYRVGDTPVVDYVGDFDAHGNLWTFHTSLNRVTKIDVDNLDENGDPIAINYDLPDDFMQGRTYDIAYNAEEDVFYAIEPPSTNGGNGTVHRIDLSNLEEGGEPQITSVEISGTLFEGEMSAGMPKGAYGAVFFDGDGNLYFGLNRGDHDLDGSTDSTGAIYQVNVDWEGGSAHAEFMATAQSTGSNDGAVDPRSADAFGGTDDEASILIRDISLTGSEGGNDKLRGAEGDDTLFGETGDDTLHGGDGEDVMDGGVGNDKLFGGAGNDVMDGDTGKDKMLGGDGGDTMSGGSGKDYVHGGDGSDQISGGDGADKLIGGAGADTIAGGTGDDHMWGGNWKGDNAADTFVVGAGGGKDMIHDFEAGIDTIDLSSYGLSYQDVQNLMSDKGWATEIDLSGLDGGQPGDKLIIKSVDPDELDESSFIL